ncbi:MAG: multicopper oxidase domain-containing protein, partial [Chloroflexales bacterium]|nr:multicopper oxidase domain-containing protein [Chloroflexales bacterium]
MKRSPALSRRALLGSAALVGLAGCAAPAQSLVSGAHLATGEAHQTGPVPPTGDLGHGGHTGITGNMLQGDVDPATNGFDPSAMLTDFDYGAVSTLPSGQTLREYTIYAVDKTIEIAPGISFPAWTYNGRVPGPTLRCTEGDRVRVTFTNGS